MAQVSVVLQEKGGANGKQLTLALGCFLEALPPRTTRWQKMPKQDAPISELETQGTKPCGKSCNEQDFQGGSKTSELCRQQRSEVSKQVSGVFG